MLGSRANLSMYCPIWNRNYWLTCHVIEQYINLTFKIYSRTERHQKSTKAKWLLELPPLLSNNCQSPLARARMRVCELTGYCSSAAVQLFQPAAGGRRPAAGGRTQQSSRRSRPELWVGRNSKCPASSRSNGHLIVWGIPGPAASCLCTTAEACASAR